MILEMILNMLYSMQEEVIIEHTNGKCDMFTFKICKGKIFLIILMSCVMCVHFSPTCRPFV